MPQRSSDQPASSTFADDFGTVGLAGVVRVVTKTMLSAWNDLPVGRRTPRDSSVASLRADVMMGKAKPIEHILRLAYAAIDAGVSVVRVTLFLRNLIVAVEEYAQRKQRRERSGVVLPFRQTFLRLAVSGQREESEAHVAVLRLNDTDLSSLIAARDELADEIAADQATLDCLSAEILRRSAAVG